MSPIAPLTPTLAFAAACLGIAIYSGMDAIMKGLSLSSGAYSAVLWRSVAGVVLTGAVFLARRGRWPGREARRLHLARGTVAGGSVLLFFWGLERVAMARAVALTFMAPLIALFLAAWLLGERVGRGAVLASLIAAAGVLVIAADVADAPTSDEALAGTAAVVAASVLYAWSLILLRRQAQLADPLEVTLFTSLVLGGWLLLGSPIFSGLPDPAQLPAIGAAAVLGTVSSLLLAWAYARAEAQLLALVEYTAFGWAALFGWIAFGERVGALTLLGTALIVGACAIAVRRAVAPAPQIEAGA